MSAPPVILGFDTATAETAVALGAERRTIGPERGRPAHATALLTAIEELVAAAGGWDAIGRVAVGIGPGSFTGLRIGVATARALAQSRSVEAVGIPSTSALLAGLGAVAAPGRARLAVIDARRGEVFAALDPGSGPGEPLVCRPEDLAVAFGAEALAGAVAGGDGAVRFRAEIEACGALVLPDEDGAHRLSASWTCELAAGAEPVAPERIRPLYLRRPDAERWRETHGSH